MNGKQMAADVLAAVKSYVERASRPLADRVLVLETRAPIPGPQGEKGLQGDVGAKGACGDVGAEGPVGPQGERGERGEPGPQGIAGPAGKDGADGLVGRSGVDGKEGPAGRDGRDGSAGVNGRDGARGEKGDPGQDGRSVEPGQVKELIADLLPERVERVQAELSGWLEDAVKAIPVPKDGKDGAAGRDGKDFSIDEVRGVLESELSKWELEFERRATAILQKSIDRMPVPADGKDGSNGKDGADGLGFDDASVEYDGKRTITVKFKNGDREKVESLKMPVMIYVGTYKAGETYEQGDSITYAGSTWVAVKDAPAVPGDPDSGWKLCAKRGGK